jgi:hypothetical protein
MLVQQMGYVMKAVSFVAKYSGTNKSRNRVPYDRVKATEKWVEYALDIADMSRMIMSADFDTKWRLAEALETAERKKAYMYKHKNFNIKRALAIFDAVKHLPKTK